MTAPINIVEKALLARTPEDAERLQDLIAEAIGNRFQRPVGDRWNNHGILTATGASYDHKILEVVTNMQDAVLELLAIQKYGSKEAVPFTTPHEAAEALLSRRDKKARAALATVTIDSSGAQSNKKRVTLVMRDHGCGITTTEVPRSIFQVGANSKNGIDWQQGTFGLGGTTTYRNAQAVVLVTRRHPDLLVDGEEDRISLAVVLWERSRTTRNAYYLVTSEWKDSSPASAVPFSVPASEYPDFTPGTHLALVGYDTEGLAKRSGDWQSFDTILNTRLYRPVSPIRYRNNLTRRGHDETLDGLGRRLRDNPASPGHEGNDTLPFNHGGVTYHLPVSFRLFAKPGEKGARRSSVAKDHALLITSNGQVHSHWSPQDFKLRTKLNKLYDRVLVVVESDALPIEVRSELFTADRTELVQNTVAKRLEAEIAAFLDQWHTLYDANAALIREAIAGDNNDRPTIAVAEKIARAVKSKGFSVGGSGATGGGLKPPSPIRNEDLYEDPTHFEGPSSIEVETGTVKGIYFKLNAKDGFLGEGRRGELLVQCDHHEIGPEAITIGELRSGRVRVSIAVPANADLGTFELTATIPPWSKKSGGLGPEFRWTTKVALVDERSTPAAGTGGGRSTGKHGPGSGGLVALVWRSDEEGEMDDWDASTVGEVQMVAAADLASERDEYAQLADIAADIPTIILNRTYSPLKSYVQARAAELTEEGKNQARDRYAVGAGVALLVLDQDERRAAKSGHAADPATTKAARQAAARAVLSVLPEYDRLVKEIES